MYGESRYRFSDRNTLLRNSMRYEGINLIETYEYLMETSKDGNWT